MKSAKKIFAILLVIAIVTTTIVVRAQELSNQLSLNIKIKTFVNANSIEIMSSYSENGMKVYKVHDTVNNKYYKLALDNKNEINWYDVVKNNITSKVSSTVESKLKDMRSDEKILVMVELKFDYLSVEEELKKIKPEYFDTKANTNVGADAIKEYKRNYISQKMKDYNVLSSDYDIFYVSKYSPFVILNVNKEDVEKLKQEEKVFYVEYLENAKLENAVVDSTESSDNLMRFAIQNNAISATRTDLVKNDGMNGSGVKIGQMELSSPDTNNSTLLGKNIIVRSNYCSSESSYIAHATEVAGILVGSNGIAPSATLYSACSTYDYDFYEGIEWLVSQNVDIINMSAGWDIGGGNYRVYDRWIDAITYMNDILFVVCAGNKEYNDPKNYVSSPALAFNSITVGNIITQSSSYLDAVNSSRSPKSYYNEYGYSSQNNKPEIVAPGTNVNYTNAYSIYSDPPTGNSFSTPVVAGASSLLMQKVPATKNDFQSIKAALFVTARPMTNYPKTIGSSDGFPVTYYHYNDEVGLGVLDTKAAYDLLRWNQYRNFTVTGGYYDSYTFYNTLSNGRTVRVAITWSKPNSATSSSNITNYGTDIVADLDLHILGPNGEKIVQSGSAHDNVEWATFTTSSGYGAYQFKVINFATNGNYVPTKVSMAWW